MDEAEFDKFADEYSQMHRASIKASGEDPEFFARYKIEDVARLVRPRLEGIAKPSVLDFGCGVGNSIPWFARELPAAALTGLDVSKKSLEVAAERCAGQATFCPFDGTTIPFEDNTFDVAFSACVFHHIPEEAHVTLLAELRRVLKVDGTIVIFEHNTRNPLTVRAVNDCPFDENAVLIPPPTLRHRFFAAGFADAKCVYRLFFPRRLSWFRVLEPMLTWLPFGAQYYVTASKRAPV